MIRHFIETFLELTNFYDPNVNKNVAEYINDSYEVMSPRQNINDKQYFLIQKLKLSASQ